MTGTESLFSPRVKDGAVIAEKMGGTSGFSPELRCSFARRCQPRGSHRLTLAFSPEARLHE
jgi:hypothetical protein